MSEQEVEVLVFRLLPEGANPETLPAPCHTESIVNSLISAVQKGFPPGVAAGLESRHVFVCRKSRQTKYRRIVPS